MIYLIYLFLNTFCVSIFLHSIILICKMHDLISILIFIIFSCCFKRFYFLTIWSLINKFDLCLNKKVNKFILINWKLKHTNFYSIAIIFELSVCIKTITKMFVFAYVCIWFYKEINISFYFYNFKGSIALFYSIE